MSVLLDRRVTEDRIRQEPERRTAKADFGNSVCLEVGLVNNMPDSALQSTERQFSDLLRAAADTIRVRVQLFSMPDVPRGDAGHAHFSRGYRGIDGLRSAGLDGLIVTGTEPRAPSLMDEPYWGSLTRLIDWAEQNTISTIWSCLAAHAAVLHLDGIRRSPLPDKCFGVFDCAKLNEHALLDDIASGLRVPHSRWNALNAEALTAHGYSILTQSDEAGVDTFIKQQESLFVFFQGHPEYDDGALLREYRRDIGRYLRVERDTYPSAPHGYFDEGATRRLAAFRKRAELERSEGVLDDFPVVMKGRQSARDPAIVQVYRNWLSYLAQQKAAREKSRGYTTIRSRRPAASTAIPGLS